jgi:O-antigen/teichoic acid export membrane protein
LHFFRTDSLISVLDRSIVIIICAVLLWTNITQQPFKIIWFVYAQTGAYAITVMIAFLIVLHHSSFFKPRISISYFSGILRRSYPFALLILLMSFYNRIDSVMLERLLPDGKTQAGIYAQSFRILDAAAMFAFLFAGLLFPIFSRMLKKGESIGGMVELSYSLIIMPAVTLSVLGLFYSNQIIGWMYHEHLDMSSKIFPLLMFGFVALSTTYIFGTLLTANKNLLELNLLALSAVVLNIVLNLLLIPKKGALGAAIASLITQGYMAIAQVVISIMRLQLDINPVFVLRLGIYIPMVYLTGWIAQKTVSSWYSGAIMLILAALLLGFLTGLLKVRDLYRMIRFNEE